LPAGDYVSFLFEDEGCGIPSENMKKIFDPYFTTKAGGSGLGLASVQSIVNRHGGRISVRSAIGRGTAFEMLLPASRQSPPVNIVMAAETAERTDAHAGISLLVMDDEEMIRELAAAMLDDLGYRVTVCANGEEAVALYKSAFESGMPFSAVIMDLTIPGGMGGREAAALLRDIDPQARLIVSSGYSNDPIMADYRQYGFSSVVLKPYGIDEIGKALNSIFMAGRPAI
jgi:CheY-like chemotaxis protein